MSDDAIRVVHRTADAKVNVRDFVPIMGVCVSECDNTSSKVYSHVALINEYLRCGRFRKILQTAKCLRNSTHRSFA